MPIYDDYDDEPADVFQPLPESVYCDFYDLEMGQFVDDLPFYQRHLPEHGNILELGCGTGRIGRELASPSRALIGIDISLPMLAKARAAGNVWCRYIAMDMTDIAFRTKFEAIIIPYNTLNLLTEPGAITACLAGCNSLMSSQSILLLQIFVSNHAIQETDGTASFQFQILEKPNGDRVVKEILRTYQRIPQIIHIEERYRVRPLGQQNDRSDFRHSMDLCAWHADLWQNLLKKTGFVIDQQYGNYDLSPFKSGQSSCLLLAAHRS